MATVTSSRVMHPVPLSQAAGGLAGGAPSVCQTFLDAWESFLLAVKG